MEIRQRVHGKYVFFHDNNKYIIELHVEESNFAGTNYPNKQKSPAEKTWYIHKIWTALVIGRIKKII